MGGREGTMLDDKVCRTRCRKQWDESPPFSRKRLHKLERSRTKAKIIFSLLEVGDEVADMHGSGEILRFGNRGNFLTVKILKR